MTMITAEITMVDVQAARLGGLVNIVTFKDCESGKSYRTWIYPKYRNAERWQPVIFAGVGTVVGNLRIAQGKPSLIDADSSVTIIRRP